MEQESVAAVLNAAFVRLKSQNSLISIRGIAAQIELSPSYLSKVFRGERELPPHFIRKLGRVLRLDHHEIGEIHRLLLIKLEQSLLSEETGITSLGDSESSVPVKYESIGKTAFWLLEEWHHLAIHNLATTQNFQNSHEWIAKRLGLSLSKVDQSIARLLTDGYLEKSADGIYQKSQLKLRIPTDRSHEAVRKFHQIMMRRAIAVLDPLPTEIEFQERLISSLSVAGDPKRITEAKLMIEEALYKAAEHLAGG